MTVRPNFPDGPLPELQPIRDGLLAIAGKYAGDATSLLAILRFLEDGHQWLRDGYYMEALPTTRHELHELLNQMEQDGSWPSLPRTRLQTLLGLLDGPRPPD